MKRRFDESSLSAFIDGELDAIGMQEVDDFLQQDSEAKQFALDTLRGTAFLKAAANATLHEQVPERLLCTLKPATPASAPPGGRRYRWRAAVAVLLTLIGFGAGILGGSLLKGTEEPAPLAALVDRYGHLVDSTLENNLSGTPHQWRRPEGRTIVTVTPVRTYRDAGMRYFREYRMQVVSGNDIREVGGLAYRTDEGKWKTTALFF